MAVLAVGVTPTPARPTVGRGHGAAAAVAAETDTTLPAAAPVGGSVLRRFDPPATPFGRGHRGVDLAAVPGEPVRAAMAGVVTFAGRVAGVAWVTVDHGTGLSTTYGGFAVTVRRGDRVTLGAPLGRATGRARLDWGARRDGGYVDPMGLLGGWEVRLVPVQ